MAFSLILPQSLTFFFSLFLFLFCLSYHSSQCYHFIFTNVLLFFLQLLCSFVVPLPCFLLILFFFSLFLPTLFRFAFPPSIFLSFSLLHFALSLHFFHFFFLLFHFQNHPPCFPPFCFSFFTYCI